MTEPGPPAFAVRPATEDDLDAMLDLFETVVVEGRWLGAEPPVDRDGHRQRLLDRLDPTGPAEVLVADAGGLVVGQVGLELAPYNVASMAMFVHPGWRRRGVGNTLVRAAVAWSRQRGAHKLSLQVWPHNVGARQLYRRHGFVEEGLLHRHYRRRNGELWDAVVMGLVLDHASPGGPLSAGEEAEHHGEHDRQQDAGGDGRVHTDVAPSQREVTG
jgi:putative acetyltransferase